MTQPFSPSEFIAPRLNEDDEEQRFREALERMAQKMIQTVDSAIELRTAAPNTQRGRHLARGELQTAMLRMMNVFNTHRAHGPARKPAKEQ